MSPLYDNLIVVGGKLISCHFNAMFLVPPFLSIYTKSLSPCISLIKLLIVEITALLLLGRLVMLVHTMSNKNIKLLE